MCGGVNGGRGADTFELLCMPLGLLTVNNRMQSVINLIYVPRHKKSKL